MSAGSDSAMRKWIDFLEKNGAQLLGTEEVEQQELWRSVMEAEKSMREQQASASTEELRSSLSEFSESSAGAQETTGDGDWERLEDPFVAELRNGSTPNTTPSSTPRSSTLEPLPIDSTATEVHARMLSMGMFREYLPSASATSKCAIFLSEDWQTCDKLIIFVGNSHGGGRGVPPGIWSRSGCSVMGIEHGSMLSYLETSQAGGFGSIVLDTSTHTNLVDINGEIQKIPVSLSSLLIEYHMNSLGCRFLDQNPRRGISLQFGIDSFAKLKPRVCL